MPPAPEDYRKLFQAIATEFNKMKTPYHAPVKGTDKCWMQVNGTGLREGIHYEWAARPGTGKIIVVAIQLGVESRVKCTDLLEKLKANWNQIAQGIGYHWEMGPFGSLATEAHFCIPYTGEFPDLDVVPECVRVMKLLIERTHVMLKAC
jgi:hypothetical protein